MTQRLLTFDSPSVPVDEPEPARASKPSIDEQFQAWLAVNPDTYAAFVRAAWRLRAQGHKRIGAKQICENMRADSEIQPARTDTWKINNVFTSRLARKLIADDPSFGEFVETRRLAGERR